MSERLKRWISKTTPETVAERLKQTRELGVEKQGTWQPQLHELNMRVKGLLNELGIPAQYHHYYISAAQEFWKLRLAGAQGPLNVQADGIAAGWKTRGLEFSVLQGVAGLLGYSPRPMMLEEDCPSGPPAAPCAYNVFKLGVMYNSIIQGTWAVHEWSYYDPFFQGFLNTSDAQNDEIQYKFSHKKGNYTFHISDLHNNNCAILTISIDGVVQGTIDLYAVGLTTDVLETLAVTVASDGEHTLNIKVATRNPSNTTGWAAPFAAWWLTD